MIAKLKKINLFILTLVILVFFVTSLIKGDDDLEKNYNDFVKETQSIRNQLNSLPASNSTEVTVIDSAIKEMDQAIEFAQENFKANDFEITEKTLNFVNRSLTDINNSVPKEFVNDLTVVNMNELKDKELKEVYQVSLEMKNNKKEKLTSLVKDMTEIDKKGLNLFEVSKNINDLGVRTISVQDIAKTVVENPSIKSEVLESAEKGISPEYLAEQLAEAEKLGIAESTEKLSEAAMSSGFNKDVMPSLETMRVISLMQTHIMLLWQKWLQIYKQAALEKVLEQLKQLPLTPKKTVIPKKLNQKQIVQVVVPEILNQVNKFFYYQ
tara:strand:+ start:257 stop:1228 length:972 start_codon:yes stop_codon:yes gene_type:complete